MRYHTHGCFVQQPMMQLNRFCISRSARNWTSLIQPEVLKEHSCIWLKFYDKRDDGSDMFASNHPPNGMDITKALV